MVLIAWIHIRKSTATEKSEHIFARKRNDRGVFRNCLLLLRLTIGVVAVCRASMIFAGELPRERIVYTTLRPANWELYLLNRTPPRNKSPMIRRWIMTRPFL